MQIFNPKAGTGWRQRLSTKYIFLGETYFSTIPIGHRLTSCAADCRSKDHDGSTYDSDWTRGRFAQNSSSVVCRPCTRRRGASGTWSSSLRFGWRRRPRGPGRAIAPIGGPTPVELPARRKSGGISVATSSARPGCWLTRRANIVCRSTQSSFMRYPRNHCAVDFITMAGRTNRGREGDL